MLVKTDFTQVPLGTIIDGQEIQTCPQCGKPGLVTHDDTIGKAYYTHSQGISSAFGNEASTGFVFCTIELEPK
jgi:hypothetical protein